MGLLCGGGGIVNKYKEKEALKECERKARSSAFLGKEEEARGLLGRRSSLNALGRARGEWGENSKGNSIDEGRETK